MFEYLLILIGLFVLPALLAAFAANLLRAAIALLVSSIGLTLLLFQMGAPLAAVFELSVCAGLITVLFVNAISLVRPVDQAEEDRRSQKHYRRFALLGLVVLLLAAALWFTRQQWLPALVLTQGSETKTVGEVLWKERGLDLIGQIAVILVGVYGIVVLFKRGKVNA